MIHVKFYKGQQQAGRFKENTKFASHINAFEANDDDEDAEEMDEDVRAMTKQRNHKTRTANANQIGASFGNVFDGSYGQLCVP
ncbi:hypothetical protein KC365_g17002 [Hortaea werneckii]|nr:hypothetical protein KC365_g17002 [Hortaea werneckii]